MLPATGFVITAPDATWTSKSFTHDLPAMKATEALGKRASTFLFSSRSTGRAAQDPRRSKDLDAPFLQLQGEIREDFRDVQEASVAMRSLFAWPIIRFPDIPAGYLMAKNEMPLPFRAGKKKPDCQSPPPWKSTLLSRMFEQGFVKSVFLRPIFGPRLPGGFFQEMIECLCPRPGWRQG